MKKLLVIPVTVATLALSMSACGGDSDDAGGSSTPSSGTSAPATPGGGGTITGNGGGGTGGGSTGGGTGGSELTPAQKQALTKLVECMRKKGYEMPEPTSPAIAPKNIEGKDPDKVNKDSQECTAQSQ
ncbi:hypothetical protein ETD83_19885 [Actinomadura soli]|uniref:PT repeat-containing protein n=1 Tax=Actinomadura soli TaxID=2508997 RepID=A0A5C4J9F9_9ACTN|nr:hypothetical protein [Actinomadura soli]TMQ97809.1 hypothetical protein ETD83_19885 [Actinomadura soli]